MQQTYIGIHTMKIVNVELSQVVFDKLVDMAKKNKRSIRAEVAIIIEAKVNKK